MKAAVLLRRRQSNSSFSSSSPAVSKADCRPTTSTSCTSQSHSSSASGRSLHAFLSRDNGSAYNPPTSTTTGSVASRSSRGSKISTTSSKGSRGSKGSRTGRSRIASSSGGLSRCQSPPPHQGKSSTNAALQSVSPNVMSSILSPPEQITGSVPDLDCPICLDSMAEHDDAHPPQCTNACGYNFCLSCVESLISSSRDDYAEASDGNMHVKVFLMCPNCRSDLSGTIRDTVLLRKADHIRACTSSAAGGRGGGGSGCRGDEGLTPSELRMRDVMDDPTVRDAITDARKREAEFFGRKYRHDVDEKEIVREIDEAMEVFCRNEASLSADAADAADDSADVSYEECGVEMDLVKGVHQSVRWPKQPSCRTIPTSGSHGIDPSLLAGLEFALSEAEQEMITDLMTSGDTSQLAAAAEMLYDVTNLTRQGKTSSSDARANAAAGGDRRAAAVRNSTRSSVFALIDEAKNIREETESRQHAREAGHVAQRLAHPNRNGRVTASQHRAAEMSIRRNMEHMKRFPLPVRMPKYVEITGVNTDPTSKKFALQFCADTWDGTLLDAYSKITIGFGGSIKKKEPRHKGVFRILNMDANNDSYSNPRSATDQPRVLVSWVSSEAGSQGVVKGDVVTHVDGEEFYGDVDALMQTIRQIAVRDDTEVLRLVLNAERSTAEALRRRATIMD